MRPTQEVSASLNVESDGKGSYLFPARARVSGHLHLAAIVVTLGKLLFGDARGERGGVHRSLELTLSAPSPLAVQYLGVFHTVGWLSRQASWVRGLDRGMWWQLGHWLARSLAGSTIQRLEQPPPPQDGVACPAEPTRPPACRCRDMCI